MGTNISAEPLATDILDTDVFPGTVMTTTPKKTWRYPWSLMKAKLNAVYMGIVSPGAAGGYLRSNGSAWARSAIQAGDVPDLSATYSLTTHNHSGVYQPLDADLTTIAGLADPNADRILFWDDSAGAYAYLTAGANLSIVGTTLSATGGGGGGTGTNLGWINVKDAPYSAVGDGVTDDTAALQAAIDAAKASGGHLYSPAGKYLYTHLDLTSSACLTIHGQQGWTWWGPDTFFDCWTEWHCTATDANPGINLFHSQGVVVEDIAFSYANGFTGVVLQLGGNTGGIGSNSILVQRCHFFSDHSGTYRTAYAFISMDATVCITIRQNSFASAQRGVNNNTVPGAFSNDHLIDNNTFERFDIAQICNPFLCTIVNNTLEFTASGIPCGIGWDQSTTGAGNIPHVTVRDNWWWDFTSAAVCIKVPAGVSCDLKVFNNWFWPSGAKYIQHDGPGSLVVEDNTWVDNWTSASPALIDCGSSSTALKTLVRIVGNNWPGSGSQDGAIINTTGHLAVEVSNNGQTGVWSVRPVATLVSEVGAGDITFQTTGTGVVKVLGTSSSQAKIRLYEQTSNGTDYVELKAPAAVSTPVSFTLPAADGTANQVLKTNGFAVWSFADAPGGSTITIANEGTDATCFLGFFTDATGTLQPKTNAGLAYNSSTQALTVTGAAGATTFKVAGVNLQNVCEFNAGTTVGQSFGLVIRGGMSAGDYGLLINKGDNSATLYTFRGDGLLYTGAGTAFAVNNNSPLALPGATAFGVLGNANNSTVEIRGAQVVGQSYGLFARAGSNGTDNVVDLWNYNQTVELFKVNGYGKSIFTAPTANAASLNLPIGTAPTSPADGDVWREANTIPGLKVRISGVTKALKSTDVLFDHFADVATTNTGGGEDDLYNDNTGAGALGNNGEELEAIYGLTVVASATATRRIQVYFAGTGVLDSGTLTFPSAGSVEVRVSIIRESSTVIRAVAKFVASGLTLQPIVVYTRVTGLTLSGSNILKITGIAAGTGAASGDITAKAGKVKWVGAA